FARSTRISSSVAARVDEGGLTYEVRLDPHGEWRTEVDVGTALLFSGEAQGLPRAATGRRKRKETMAKNLGRWIADPPRGACGWEPRRTRYRRSLVDLAALRFAPPIAGGRSLPAAGLPWFMTMFGRDSIFTSLQALPFTPELAEATLLALASWQGTRVD